MRSHIKARKPLHPRQQVRTLKKIKVPKPVAVSELVAVGPLVEISEPVKISAPATTLLSKLYDAWQSHGVAAISLGAVWESAGNTQTFYLAPNIEKTYAATSDSHGLIDGEVFLGLQKSLRERLDGQIGLAVATTGNATLSGYIWDDASPEFNNYTYNYQVTHTHIAVKGKLLSDRGFAVTPWVSGSLGVAFNQAHAFSNTPIISEAVVMPGFSAQTITTLTYTLGVGFQRNLNRYWQVGLGYEFADWGKSQLDRAPEQVFNSGLKLSHLYTNGVLLNLTYVA